MTIVRKAVSEDIPSLKLLIEQSARELGRAFYSAEQIEGALAGAWGVDSQLIADGTYFVAEAGGDFAACGGWSRRKTLFGGDAAADRVPHLLDAATEAARIRAFFVHPKWARRGLGNELLKLCETELTGEGFRRAELVATLPGVPFYRKFGYREMERIQHPLPNGLAIEFVRMTKAF